MSTEKSASFEAGFEFARKLRNSEFRNFLKSSGWASGEHIIMASDDDPVVEVLAKLIIHETGERAFIAITTPASRHGFRIVTVEKVKPKRGLRRRKGEPTVLDAGASIGMLLAMLEPCGDFIPSKWAEPLRFELAGSAA